VRVSGAVAIGAIGPAAKDAVDALAKALKDKSKAVKEAALEALGDIGPDAKSALPAIKVFAASASKDQKK
ncbi:HEAT repeat domain-containing protein, partial [Escherichia coli]